MQNTLKFVSIFALVACFAAAMPVKAAVDQKAIDKANSAIALFKSTDPGMNKLFTNAVGYAVFPSVGKGGFVFGGAHGGGLLFEKGKIVGRTTLTQFTVGAQIGGQEFAEVIFFENKEALDRFKENRFEMTAQVGAVVAAEGASKNARYVNGVMVFTKGKTGLMAEAAVGGQKFTFTPVPVETKQGAR